MRPAAGLKPASAPSSVITTVTPVIITGNEEEVGAPIFVVGRTGKERFAPNRLADALRAECPVAVGGELLYRYRGGAYRPDGERWARRRVAEILEDDWSRVRADEVIAHLRDLAESLLERPPLGVINVRNGLLELDTLSLLPHDPALLTSVQIGAAYDPAATCPAIDRFVTTTFPDDAAELAWQIAGYLTVPDSRLQRAVMCKGGGENGKSVFLSLLTAFLGGRDNVSSQPLHKLDEDRFAAADLYGKLAQRLRRP